MTLRLAYMCAAMGGLSHTFVHREIDAFRQMGASITLFSTTFPEDKAESHDLLRTDETTYLYRIPKAIMCGSMVRIAIGNPKGFRSGLRALLRDMMVRGETLFAERLKLPWHFLAGSYLARQLMLQNIQHLHIHFAHTPTSVGMYGAMMAGIPYSFMGHANDLFQRAALLKEKVQRSAFSACISQHNKEWLCERGCDESKLHIVRCAIDTGQYSFRFLDRSKGPLNIVSVARLVEKKGIIYLIEAIDELRRRGIEFQCRIIGDGPLYEELARAVSSLDLEEEVKLTGSLQQEDIQDILRNAHVFVLPCIVDSQGDQDGIPVALMEAMALGVPVISTPVSGIPELIESESSGLLVQPKNSLDLAEAIVRIDKDDQLRARLAKEARARIESEFDLSQNVDKLYQLITDAVNRFPEATSKEVRAARESASE